jgi:hypothetical protein
MLRVLRIFVCKGQELTGGCRKLHSEELHDFYCVPNMWVMVSRGMMCGACGTYGGDRRCIQGFGGEAEERGHLGDLGIEGRLE